MRMFEVTEAFVGLFNDTTFIYTLLNPKEIVKIDENMTLGYDIQGLNFYYFIVDSDNNVIVVTHLQQYNKDIFQIKNIKAYERNKNLGLMLLTNIIKHVDIRIINDFQQSSSAQKMWLKLSQISTVVIFNKTTNTEYLLSDPHSVNPNLDTRDKDTQEWFWMLKK